MADRNDCTKPMGHYEQKRREEKNEREKGKLLVCFHDKLAMGRNYISR